MRDLRGILFDLDDTLIDRIGCVRRYWSLMLPEADVELIDRLVQADTGSPLSISRSLTRLRHAGELSPAVEQRIRIGFAPRVAAHLAPDTPTLAMLSRLKTRFRLGVLTDGGPATQRAKLSAAGLDQVINTVVISGEIGYRKPARQAFAIALEQLRLSAEQVLMVGNDIVRDIQGGSAAGLRTCWLTQANELAESTTADYRLSHRLELEGLLTCLTPAA